MQQFLNTRFPFDTTPQRTQRVCVLKKANQILNFLEKFPKKDWSIETWKYALDNNISPGYLVKVIHMMNSVLEYQGEKQCIKKPSGQYHRAIKRAHKSKGKYSCDPLTPELLKKIKPHLRPKTYNFFFITLWLGLRPSELLSTKTGKKWSILKVNGCKVLKLYQNKLYSKDESARWKYIPILEAQQEQALKLLELEAFTRPSITGLQKKALTDCTKMHIGRYSGRKGFVPTMLQLGHDVQKLSRYLGHSSIGMTVKHYVDHENLQIAELKRDLNEI